MITKFKQYQLISESPDVVFIKEEPYVLDVESPDSKPFFCEVNEQHTEATKIYFGESGYHDDMSDENLEGVYYGRLWLDSKVISFWIYPKDKLFNSIIKKIEENLKIRIFNNDWRIEVVKKNYSIVKTKDTQFKSTYDNDYDYDDGTTVLIPIEDYTGSADFSKEKRLWHLMNAKEKQKVIAAGKRPPIIGGSHLTAWDQPRNIKWRQALRQESKKY